MSGAMLEHFLFKCESLTEPRKSSDPPPLSQTNVFLVGDSALKNL